MLSTKNKIHMLSVIVILALVFGYSNVSPALAATAPAIAQSAPRYSITELQGVARQINSNGEIAGWIYVGADAHAAIYSNGAWRDLGVPAGDQMSAFFGINDAGAAAGFSFAALPGSPSSDNRWQAIWAPAGANSVQSLSALTPDSFAYAINDSDAIVGCLNRYDDSYPDPYRAFLYSNDTMTNLHDLLIPPATQTPFDFTCARDINDAGDVVGEVELLGRPRRGFVYRNGVVTRLEQGMSYLVNAKAISSSGKIVGEGWQNGFTAYHALAYDVATGAITSLGLESAGAYFSRPNDINGRGDVVGTMYLPVGEHAFLASGGQVFDLNDLIPAGSGWVLQEALSINDRGQIVSAGYLTSAPNVSRYFLLQAYGMVVAWGDNLYGQSSVPAGLDNVSAISAGAYHSLALRSDGTVVAWGRDDFGQSTVPAGLNGVIEIGAGGYHSLALKGDGTVVAWGRNDSGQATVPAGLNGVIAIAAGGFHSLALKSDGTVVTWGANFSGQATVPVGLNGVIAIDAGGGHSLALKSDGTVVAWGHNFSGQATVPVGLNGVTAIEAGSSQSLALKSDGTVVAWGDNFYGQATVPDGLNGVTSIDAGGSYNLALKSDGTVVAWGANSSGQATVPVGLVNVFAIAAGGVHNLALIPPDTTAPVITPNVVGTLGSNGWYVSDVTVTWSVVDNESPISSQTDCGSTTLSSDTASTTLTCSATSAGGSTSQSVTVKLDKTAPTVDAGPDATIILGSPYTGAGTFSDPGPATWTATVDYGDGSGVQSLALAGHTFALDHLYATAGIFKADVAITDEAGNLGTAAIVVTVLMTPQQGTEGLIDQVQSLIGRGVLSEGHGNALISKLDGAIKQLEKGKTKTAINELQAFISQVNDFMSSTPPILMPSEGQPLIDAANAIIAALGG